MTEFPFDLDSIGNLNFLDMGIILIFAFCIFGGWRKGLVRSVFDLFSLVIAFFITGKVYPYIGALMRVKGGPYDMLKKSIAESMGLRELIGEHIALGADAVIGALYYPDFIKGQLVKMNSPDVYSLLGAANLEEYISGYLANILINTATSLLVFVAVWMIMKAIVSALDIITKLPVIHTFNKAGGIISGAFTGLIFTWIFLAGYTLFYLSQKESVWQNITGSLIARYFYENNILLNILLKIFKV